MAKKTKSKRAKAKGSGVEPIPTVDSGGRPILPGCIVSDDPNATYGRVLLAGDGVLLYRGFPGSDFTGDRHRLLYANGTDCTVVEDPPPAGLSSLPPAAAAAADVAARLAAIQNELALAEGVAARADELRQAQTHIGDAINEVLGLVRQHIDDGDTAGAELADALERRAKGGQRP